VDAVVPPERLEEDVSLAFQRLVAHTLSQCQAHPLWSDDVGRSASASSSADVSTAQCRPSVDTLTECIEKLVAAKTYVAAAACFQHVNTEADAALRSRCHGLRLMVMPAHVGLPQCMLDACYDHTWSLLRGELSRLSGYHTPRDKLVCLCNCSRLLMGLLSACREREALGKALSSGEPPATHEDVDGAAPTPSPRSRRPATADDLLPAIVYACMRLAPPALVSELRYIRHVRGPDALRSEAGYHLTNFESAVQVLQDFGPDSLAYCPDELRAAWPSTFAEVTEGKLVKEESAGTDDSRPDVARLVPELLLSCLVPAPSIGTGQAVEKAFEAWFAAKEAIIKDCTADTLTLSEAAVLLAEYRNLLQTARQLHAAASLPQGGPPDADANRS